MSKVNLTMNWFIFILIPLTLWLGFTNRVDWWIIILIICSHIRINK